MYPGATTDGSTEETTEHEVGSVTADNYTPGPDESATETARNIAKLLSEQDSSGDEGERDEEEENTQEAPSEEDQDTGYQAQQSESEAQKVARARDEHGKFVKKEAQPKFNSADLQPPASLRPDLHKAWQSMPQGLRKEANTIFKSMQADHTRKSQQLSESLKRSEGILNSASNYINQNNLRDQQGAQYTPQRLFDELLSAHNNITADPDRYLAQMIQRTGANVENINHYLQGKNPSGVDVSKDPTIRSLQEEINRLKTDSEARRNAEAQARIAPAASQFEAVIREIDPTTGNYRYPELFDESFLDSVKPVVSSLMAVDSNLSHGDALRKAYHVLTGKAEYSNNTSPRPVPTRESKPDPYRQRAELARTQVRGRVSPRDSGNGIDLELADIPQSPYETARLIYNRLQGG